MPNHQFAGYLLPVIIAGCIARGDNPYSLDDSALQYYYEAYTQSLQQMETNATRRTTPIYSQALEELTNCPSAMAETTFLAWAMTELEALSLTEFRTLWNETLNQWSSKLPNSQVGAVHYLKSITTPYQRHPNEAA